MTRNEYLGALRQGLRSLPQQEQEEALRYYEEYFDDAGPENEAQVIAELGSPEELARDIIQNSVFSLTKVSQDEAEDGAEEPRKTFRQMGPPKKEAPKTEGSKALLWILIILSSIIWVPLLVGVVGTVAGLLIGLVALVVGIAIAAVATLVAFVFCLGMGVPLLVTSTADGALLIGLSLMYLAVTLFFAAGCVLMFRHLLPWCWKQWKRFWGFLRRKTGDLLK